MAEAFLVDGARTPVGRHRGALREVRPDDLAAVPLRALGERLGFPLERVDEVILGCANQAGEDNRNVARMALLLAGFPDEVPGVTVNRLCASGLEAIAQGARLIRLGEADLVLAGGVESMTRAPWSFPKPANAFPTGKVEAWDTSLGWRYPNQRLADRLPLEPMGETAENVRERYGVTREDQDAFALASHQKAIAAWESGRFAEEVVPVEIPQRKGPPVVVDRDEGPRPETSLQKLANLRAVFRTGGTVTAGNSSTLNDGAAAVLLASERALRDFGLRPRARWVTSATVGLDPRVMGLGPIPASRRALARAGLVVDDIALWEINEAFAVQALVNQRELEIPDERLNVNGGAIALGHPLGASGARLTVTLLHELLRRRERFGVATMCVGVGQGMAAVIESLE